MANCNRQQLNITCGTDVVLHDTLIFDGETFDPALSVGITANLVSSLGKRTALEVEVADGALIIYVPWVERNAGYYGLEVTGSCNSKKWSTYADSLIHYTRATEIGVAEVTIGSDYYDITQVVGYRYSTSPIDSVVATVDDQVGTPDVDADYDRRVLSFEFHNLKGNRGNGIASSSEVLSPDDGGTNTHTFTDDDGNEHVFHTKNGQTGRKGDQGDSAIFTGEGEPWSGLKNTTGQSTTEPMTQKAITEGFDKEDTWEETPFDVSRWGKLFYAITGDAFEHYSSPSTRGGLFIPISGGEEFRVVKGDVPSYRIEFLSELTFPPISGERPAFTGNNGESIGYKSDAEMTYIAPDDARYMYVQRYSGSTWRIPTMYVRKRKEDYKEIVNGIMDGDTDTMLHGVKVLEGWALYNDDQKMPMIHPSENNYVTDYIPCKNEDVLDVIFGSNVVGVSCVHVYDQYKNFLGFYGSNSTTWTGQRTITLNNEGAAYFRLCYRTRGFASVNGVLVFSSDWIGEGVNERDASLLIGQTVEKNYSAKGNNSTAVTINLGHLKPGARYRLVIEDIAPWETGRDFLTGKNTLFYLQANNPTYVHYQVIGGMPILPTLDFTARENSDYIVGFRASSEETVTCKLLSPASETVSELTGLAEIAGDLVSLDIKDNVWNNAVFLPEYQEVVPEVADVINRVRHNNAFPSNNYHSYTGDEKYLSWWPMVWIAGGGTLTLNLTGARGVTISEWPWRELNVGLGSTNYANTDLIKQTTITAADVIPTDNVATLKLQPATKRIVVTFNYGETCTPSQISESITSAILPVASWERWTFRDSGDEEEVVTPVVNENAFNLLSLASEAHWVSPKRAQSGQLPMLCLLHFSDIHSSDKAVPEIKLAMAKYQSFIDDVLCTGDVTLASGIYSNPSDDASKGLTWWKNTGLAELSLFSIGNHDVNKEGQADQTREECHDNYYAPYAEGLGITFPLDYDNDDSPHYKATYWHKDYTTQHVRLISIDSINHFDGILDPTTGNIISEGYNCPNNSQEVWLVEKLNETLPGSGSSAEGYAVVIVSHYPLDNFSAENAEWDDETHRWVCNQSKNGGMIMKPGGNERSNWHCYYNHAYEADQSFHLRNRNKTGTSIGSVNNIGNILEYWMGGYVHAVDTAGKDPQALGWYEKTLVDGRYSYVLTEDNSPQSGKMYFIKSNVEGAKFVAWLCGHAHKDMFFYPSMFPNILNVAAQMAGHMRDQHYMNRSDACLAANLVFIDQYLGHLKILRVGNSMNLYLRPTTYLCYDYKNHVIISEG